jgi:hypothetical protein
MLTVSSDLRSPPAMASNPLSMMLVLDRSGSMELGLRPDDDPTPGPRYCGWGWYRYQCGTDHAVMVDVPKIDVLKEAVGQAGRPHRRSPIRTDEYARIGAVCLQLRDTATSYDKFRPSPGTSRT